MEVVTILNVGLQNLSRQELLERMKSGLMINPNVDVIMKTQRDEEFLRIVREAEFRICDSQIVKFASMFLGTPIKERISGADFFGEFCSHHANNPDVRIFLLGAAEGVAEKARVNVNRRVGRDIITHAHSPSFGFERKAEESRRIVDLINASSCTVLAIGVGCPKQEKWAARHRDLLTHVQLILCIGATIDFEAGSVRRAPAWMSDAGLEWMYRLLSEPKRLARRYLIDDLPFIWLLLRQRLGVYRPPFRSM